MIEYLYEFRKDLNKIQFITIFLSDCCVFLVTFVTIEMKFIDHICSVVHFFGKAYFFIPFFNILSSESW